MSKTLVMTALAATIAFPAIASAQIFPPVELEPTGNYFATPGPVVSGRSMGHGSNSYSAPRPNSVSQRPSAAAPSEVVYPPFYPF